MPPVTHAHAAAEAPPTLLDALARAPAAAALVFAALEWADRRALRLAHPQLRDAVGEATTKLQADLMDAAAARPLTPHHWPRLEELTVSWPDLAALEALGSGAWASLRSICIDQHASLALDVTSARALVAALWRMPALRALELRSVRLSDEAAAELFRASRVEGAPQLRELSIRHARLTLAAARMLASAGWRLEALNLWGNEDLGAAGVAALVAAPTFLALRSLDLSDCGLDAAALLAVANAHWPLEELDLSQNDFSAAAAAAVTALAALSRIACLRCLHVGSCKLSAAGFKALVEATWPALDDLVADNAAVAFDGPHALGAAAFAGFPALEVLDLHEVRLGEAGAALLASRRWPRLGDLYVSGCAMGDGGLAALARGDWAALWRIDLRWNDLGAPLTLEDARRWAPKLVQVEAGEEEGWEPEVGWEAEEEGWAEDEAGGSGAAGGGESSGSGESEGVQSE